MSRLNNVHEAAKILLENFDSNTAFHLPHTRQQGSNKNGMIQIEYIYGTAEERHFFLQLKSFNSLHAPHITIVQQPGLQTYIYTKRHSGTTILLLLGIAVTCKHNGYGS